MERVSRVVVVNPSQFKVISIGSGLDARRTFTVAANPAMNLHWHGHIAGEAHGSSASACPWASVGTAHTCSQLHLGVRGLVQPVVVF